MRYGASDIEENFTANQNFTRIENDIQCGEECVRNFRTSLSFTTFSSQLGYQERFCPKLTLSTISSLDCF